MSNSKKTDQVSRKKGCSNNNQFKVNNTNFVFYSSFPILQKYIILIPTYDVSLNCVLQTILAVNAAAKYVQYRVAQEEANLEC